MYLQQLLGEIWQLNTTQKSYITFWDRKWIILYQIEISEGLSLFSTDKFNTEIYFMLLQKVQAFDIFAMPRRST